MSEIELNAATRRLMALVDYYLHCELDAEYQHSSPEAARARLEAGLRDELNRATAIGVLTAVANPESSPLGQSTMA